MTRIFSINRRSPWGSAPPTRGLQTFQPIRSGYAIDGPKHVQFQLWRLTMAVRSVGLGMIACLSFCLPASGQDLEDLRGEVRALRREVESLRDELQKVRGELARTGDGALPA